MNENQQQQNREERPPGFGSWRKVYFFVAAFFVIEVIGFYLFTQHYK